MDSIERYELEFDKWTNIEITLPMPMHDFQILTLNYTPTACSLLLLGGQSNDTVLKRPYIFDITLELDPKKKNNVEIGKVYYPICSVDDKRAYIFSGY